MNIIIPFEYNHKNGGTQKAILDLVNIKNKNIKFFSLLPMEGDFKEELIRRNVQVYTIGSSDRFETNTSRLFMYIRSILNVSFELIKLRKRKNIKIIYANMLPSLLSGYLVKLIYKDTRLVYHVRVSQISKSHKFVLRIINHFIDKIIVNTKATSLEYKSLENKKVVIPDSTDFHLKNMKFERLKEKNVINIALIGRITSIKGHLEYVEISSKIIEKIGKDNLIIKFRICGKPISKEDKDYFDKIREKISAHHLDDYFVFDGYIEDINKYLKEIDIVFCPTLYPGEGFGKVVIESFSNYIPVIGFNHGSLPYIIDNGKDGFLVNDTDEFSIRAIELINNKNLIERMGNEGYKKVCKFYDSKINNIKLINTILGEDK